MCPLRSNQAIYHGFDGSHLPLVTAKVAWPAVAPEIPATVRVGEKVRRMSGIASQGSACGYRTIKRLVAAQRLYPAGRARVENRDKKPDGTNLYGSGWMLFDANGRSSGSGFEDTPVTSRTSA
jgi:hypothetical protein